MPHIRVAPSAQDDLTHLITFLKLPRNTRARVRASIRPLSAAPEAGAALTGRWQGYRYILGPWDWMVIVYAHDPGEDQVNVVTIQDARTAYAATGSR
jgi:plasmid stabilization system protein ParE